MALVATGDGAIVGVARYIRLGATDAAEVAFVVEDDRQGHGIGRHLLILLAHLAWGDGVRRFVADTLVTNGAMLSVFTHTLAAVRVSSSRREGSVVRLVMEVQPPREGLAVVPDPSI